MPKTTLWLWGWLIVAGVILDVGLSQRAQSFASYPLRNYPGAEMGSGAAVTVSRLSDQRGPRIDDEAMFTDISSERKIPASLPVELWLLWLLTYLTVLIFNLAYNFSTASHVQWGWELFYTFLALLGWWYWDGSRTAIWFPLAVIQMGLLIFVAYLYFWERKSSKS